MHSARERHYHLARRESENAAPELGENFHQSNHKKTFYCNRSAVFAPFHPLLQDHASSAGVYACVCAAQLSRGFKSSRNFHTGECSSGICALAVSLLAAPLLLHADVIRADYFDEYHVVRTRALHTQRARAGSH
jgi:hypothetical protein